jgi:hypothetical protein
MWGFIEGGYQYISTDRVDIEDFESGDDFGADILVQNVKNSAHVRHVVFTVKIRRKIFRLVLKINISRNDKTIMRQI